MHVDGNKSLDKVWITLLQEVEILMLPSATGKGLSLSTTLVTPVPEHILSDPTRLRQILAQADYVVRGMRPPSPLPSVAPELALSRVTVRARWR